MRCPRIALACGWLGWNLARAASPVGSLSLPVQDGRFAPDQPRAIAAPPGDSGGETAARASRDSFRTLPYLQNVHSRGITVMWERDGQQEARVEYGASANHGFAVPATVEASGFGTFIYRAVIDGLEPDREYHFRVAPTEADVPDRVFRTAPEELTAFSFAVWSDSQGVNRGAYAPDPYEPTVSMMAHMAASGIDFAVTAGDLAEDGASYADTRAYYLDRVARHLGQTVPWFVAWGNHDRGRDAVIRKFADLPSKDRRGFTPGYGSYSFDYAGCHFVCLDYATMRTDITVWLESDLSSEASRNARFTFLFVHVPPYCELWFDGDSDLRSRLVPLLERYGVDVCFSGHTHEYSRGYRHHVHYCVTGGGSWLDLPEQLVVDWPHMTVGGQHAIPGVSRPGEDRGGGLINEYVRVEVTPAAFTARMIGFDPSGKAVGVLDEFSSAPPLLSLDASGASRASLLLRWSGGVGPFQLQRTFDPMAGPWEDFGSVRNTGGGSVRLVNSAVKPAFFRWLDLREP